MCSSAGSWSARAARKLQPKRRPMTQEEGSQIMRLKRKSLISLLAFGGFALTGCSVGPQYARPNVAVDPSFHNATPTTYGPNEPIAQFWTQFHDPMLDRLVAEG